MSEKDLEKNICEIAKLGAENKNIDVASLMLNALELEKRDVVSSTAKRWAYLISIGVPPLGLIFAAKYYFSEKSDGKTVAWICIGLTVFSLVIGYFTFNLILSTAGVDPAQLQQAPAQLNSLINN